MTGTTTAVSSSSHSRTGHPILAIGFGIAMVALFLWGLLIQIQTSEAMLQGMSNVNISFSNWYVLMQIPNMFVNQYSFEYAMSVFLAWSIECAYFAAIVFFDKCRSAVSQSGAFMEKIFMIGIGLCVLYNFVSDYSCGSIGSGIWGHVAFSMLASFVEAFFGVVGIALIMSGWRRA
jgi:hypothetical protein